MFSTVCTHIQSTYCTQAHRAQINTLIPPAAPSPVPRMLKEHLIFLSLEQSFC